MSSNTNLPKTSGPHRSSGAPTEPLLDIRDLYVEYLTSRGPVGAVDGVSFSIARGEVFGLAGESGCGKSTIAHSILRVLRPPAVITGGEILFKGRDVLEMDSDALQSFRWSEAAMVFQSALNSLNPVMRIKDQIGDVLVKHKKMPWQEAYKIAAELLETVGIEHSRMDAYPHELSGGMRQRVVIAIALALHPPLLIMDEPTTALDVVVQKDILQQIEQIKQDMGFSILFITHDLSLMVEFSNRIGIMYAGKLVELSAAKEFFSHPMHPYTQGLLGSFPSLVGEKSKLIGIPGAPPDLAAPPPGCRFHPRCPLVMAQCRESVPALREVCPGHWVACYLDGGA